MFLWRPPIILYRWTRLRGPIKGCHIAWVTQHSWVSLPWDTTISKNSTAIRGSRWTVWTCWEGFPSFLAALELPPAFSFGQSTLTWPGSKQLKNKFFLRALLYWSFLPCLFGFLVFLGVVYFFDAHFILWRTRLNLNPLVRFEEFPLQSERFLLFHLPKNSLRSTTNVVIDLSIFERFSQSFGCFGSTYAS